MGRLLLLCFFFFNDTATTEICTLSLHDALPISIAPPSTRAPQATAPAARARVNLQPHLLTRLLFTAATQGAAMGPATPQAMPEPPTTRPTTPTAPSFTKPGKCSQR